MRLPLQEDLESARQQLHHAEQESKALVAAQLLEHEAAWKSILHDSQQKLQQARDEIAVRSAESSPQYCHLIADCTDAPSGKQRWLSIHGASIASISRAQAAVSLLQDLEQRLQDLRLSSAPSPAVPDSNGHDMSTNPLYAEACFFTSLLCMHQTLLQGVWVLVIQ